eukprot:TRINITY_DN7028_c0_g1_i2.p1 TRINITY_DN7028_c0_g1~~TRINITY_DN7028_c0_g1_i2.p1  ORF type:complete len:164 (+),score=51.43 TRINITY_DN7028_c0_g1_i2:61-492(+)
MCIRDSIGTFLEISSAGALFSFALGSGVKFAIVFSLGNLVSLAGTTFLVGYKKQYENMFDETRRIASIVYLASIVLCIVLSLAIGFALLVFALVVVQYCAYVWYCASYIPFARDFIKGCVGKIFSSSNSGPAPAPAFQPFQNA